MQLIDRVQFTLGITAWGLAGVVVATMLARWQTSYLPIYAAWAAVVVVAFPPVFGFA